MVYEMMAVKKYIQLVFCFAVIGFVACNKPKQRVVTVYETSAGGHSLTQVQTVASKEYEIQLTVDTTVEYQTITGIGGSFTEATAQVLSALSDDKRQEVLNAYFGSEGAQYSLTRTHMGSCDFSLTNYSYAAIAGDKHLDHFSIKEDLNDLIPLILDAQNSSETGFKIIASPWTAPPWMKDNNSYVGGKLRDEYQESYAQLFVKYLDAYKKKGIDIWGLTVVNEPHGNGNNWESMHFSPDEMTSFVRDVLGPTLEKSGWNHIKILGYDQNRAGLDEWTQSMYANQENAKYFSGTAIHWYESTFKVFEKSLQRAHVKAPDKYLIQTEACVDSEVPHWRDDAWYWKKEATDWGWDWAPEDQKEWHPKYSPVHRYARDIIGCLNNWVDGWVDWNMVLNKQGGPNWFKNWCVAPVIVDTEAGEVYYTPLYNIMVHFSKFIRPGAKRIHWEHQDSDLLVTAVRNPDTSLAVVVFNPSQTSKVFQLKVAGVEQVIRISKNALQTIVIKTNQRYES